MASRKEEKERLRQARLEAERQSASEQRKRLILGYVVAGFLTAAVIAGVIAVIATGGDDGGEGGADLGGPNAAIQPESGTTANLEPDDREGTEPPEAAAADDLEQAAEAAGCELRTELPNEGTGHLDANAPVPDYETRPPTSGDHAPTPLADGAYLETPSPLNVVHSLEHGRVAFHYEPSLDEEAQLEIKGLFLEDPAGMLMFPNPDMPFAVAATAWTNLLGCESYDGEATLEALRAFRDEFRGRGPEQIPLSF